MSPSLAAGKSWFRVPNTADNRATLCWHYVRYVRNTHPHAAGNKMARTDFAAINPNLRSFRSSLRDCRRAGSQPGPRSASSSRDYADDTEVAVLPAVAGKI